VPSSDHFKYDVAFSFLVEDEALARRLNDLLAARVSTFFYSDAQRQKQIAGRDGDAVYSRVFAEEARTVVVLYRPAWGERGFTQIEATAIRNRAYDRGLDFVTFIPLHNPPSVPAWLPKSRVWIGLERWGIDHAAAVIESRIQEAGGSPKEETAEDAAARVSRQVIAESERRATLDSSQGARAAELAFEQIFEHLTAIAERSSRLMKAPTRSRSNPHRPACEVVGFTDYWKLHLVWNPAYLETSNNGELIISEWDGHGWDMNYPEMQFEGMSGPKQRTKFVFDVNESGEFGWRLKTDPKGRFFSNRDVADWAAKRLIARIEAERLKKQ
jgi:hypothetical protein